MRAWFWFWGRREEFTTSPVRPRPARPASYVDPALCADCHAELATTYRRTGMGRSFYRPSAENTGKGITYYHAASASYFTMEQRDGRFFQGRYQIGFDGKRTNLMEKQIDFVWGRATTCDRT